MLIFHAALLAALILLHVIGGAVLFRKIFPRESPWWGFFIPALALLALLDFVEHGIGLPELYILAPFSTAGMIGLLAISQHAWRGLRFPALLFVGIFLFTFGIKCLETDINFYCTEGLTNYNRVLDFCFGDALPPIDSWLPPYEHTGYYTFMHYGASVLKRLFNVDVGTACNLGSALVSALSMMACGAAAHSLGRNRNVITALVVIVMAGGFTGSAPLQELVNPLSPDPMSSIDLDYSPDAPPTTAGRLFHPLIARDASENAYRIYSPGCYIYYSEFHATMGGEFLALLAVFAAAEAMRRKRAYFAWVYLIVAPALAFITCAWFLFIVGFLAIPTMLFAWWLGRRPPNWRKAFIGGAVGLGLLTPAIADLAFGSAPHNMIFGWEDIRHDFWMVIIQWWPVYLPWLVLALGWRKMTVPARWLHFLFVPMWIWTELVYFTDRGTTLEKTWSGLYGVGGAMLYPALLAHRGWLARGLGLVIVLSGVLMVGEWSWGSLGYAQVSGGSFYLSGDHFLTFTPQLLRMREVLRRFHGQTIVAGRANYAFFEAPCLPAFTENRCYLGWTNAEETAGHPLEARARQIEINAFFDEKVPRPRQFLETRNIAAILIWPDDKIADAWLDRMKRELGPDYNYIDCKGDGEHNAGVFVKTYEPGSSDGNRD